MRLFKALLASVFFSLHGACDGCPSCMGSMDDPKSGNLTYILSGFIILTYIPFYFIYKTIVKNKDFNKQVDDGKPE